MGRKKQNKSTTDQFDSSDTDSIASTSTGFSDLTLAHETENINSLDFLIEKGLEALDTKGTRLKALKELIEAFEGHILLPYLDNKCMTLLDEYMNSVKKVKGSAAAEACLACRAIGLLAITVGSGSTAHDIMEQSLPYLEKAIIAGNDAVKILALDCVAIITFVGANNWDETEKSMRMLWEIINFKPISKVNKPSSALLTAAISAWSFLLTTIGGCRIDLDSWVEPITVLCTRLENDDRAVRVAAGEAVTILFETVIGSKLSNETSDGNPENEQFRPKWFKPITSLKAKVKNQVVELSMEAGGKGTTDKKNLNSQRDLFQKIHRYFEDEECPETSTKLAKGLGTLVTSSWTQLIQLNFIKRYLASGFLKHAKENELLHDIFDITPDKIDNLSSHEKRANRSSENKGRTQERNKYRQLAQQRKRGHIFAQDD